MAGGDSPHIMPITSETSPDIWIGIRVVSIVDMRRIVGRDVVKVANIGRAVGRYWQW